MAVTAATEVRVDRPDTLPSCHYRLTECIALRCVNKRYAEVLVPPRALASSKLRIVGKVVARMGITGV
jgi:hypothetical protein